MTSPKTGHGQHPNPNIEKDDFRALSHLTRLKMYFWENIHYNNDIFFYLKLKKSKHPTDNLFYISSNLWFNDIYFCPITASDKSMEIMDK